MCSSPTKGDRWNSLPPAGIMQGALPPVLHTDCLWLHTGCVGSMRMAGLLMAITIAASLATCLRCLALAFNWALAFIRAAVNTCFSASWSYP